MIEKPKVDDSRTAKAANPMVATIGGWLSREQGIEFEAYSAELGLDMAALATILIVRELNHDKLLGLIDSGTRPRSAKGKRVSARTKQVKLKERFSEHAAKHGLSPDAAAAMLFRAELTEKWLGRCLGFRGNQLDSQTQR